MIIEKDGKTVNFNTYYGYDGIDYGNFFPTKLGLYFIGSTMSNKNANTGFSTTGQKLIGNNGGFKGFISAYFKQKNLTNAHKNIDPYIEIFPNPTTDFLNINSEISLPLHTKISVYDLNGKIVLKQGIKENKKITINVCNLQSGVYILELQGENLSKSYKFIKNN